MYGHLIHTMKNLSLFFILSILVSVSFAQKVEFKYVGDIQTYIVPEGVYTLEVELYGAGGGNGQYEDFDRPGDYVGGKGALVKALLPVTPGSEIYVMVGGKGEDATFGKEGKGGFNGGGDGNETGKYGPYCGGGGGGASDIRIGGKKLTNRFVVAGGAGGSGANYPEGGDHGGDAGENGFSGEADNGTDHESCGKGGTQKSGGKGGLWPKYYRSGNGSLGAGGHAADSCAGGGGGGGYYGGGAGCWSGGGGGSSYADPIVCTNVKIKSGVNSGDGKVIIRPIYSATQEDQ